MNQSSPTAEASPLGLMLARFNRLLDNFNLILFVLLLVVATLQVMMRYVVRMPLPWTEELARFLLFMMFTVTYIAKKRGYPLRTRASLHQVALATARAFFPLLSPAILIGGIWLGVFTPTEAAAVAVVYSLVLGLVLYRELSLKDLIRVTREALDDSAVLLFIISAASLYGWLLARYRVPVVIAESILSLTDDPLIILIIINLFLLAVGFFMESLAAINILTPILMPLAIKVGINPIHFGVMMVLNLMIGLITPPVGMLLYATQRVAGIPFERLQKAILIFFIPLLLVLVAIIVFPPLTTWLPSTILHERGG